MPGPAELAPIETQFELAGESVQREEEKPQDHCGVVAVASFHQGAPQRVYDGLVTLVNRGDQGAGIGVHADGHAMAVGGEGPANKALRDGSAVAGYMDQHVSIGHVLYTTQDEKEIQPIVSNDQMLVHNGNIRNAPTIARRYGIEIHDGTSDSGVLAQAVGKQSAALGSTEEALDEVLPQVRGAFSILIQDKDKIIAARDRVGFRPLEVGELADGGWAAASETPVFDMIDAKRDHSVAPGTYEVITQDGIQKTVRWAEQANKAGSMVCGMEFAYFARADAEIEGTSVALAREKIGEFLGEDHPVDVDMVAPIPDSGRQAATGLAARLGKISRDVFYKNHAVGRTYIQPVNRISKAVKLKLNPIKAVVEDQSVALADDSIVRGNTSRGKIHELRSAGAKEVHMYSAFPKIINSCEYGINMNKADGLVADGRSNEEIAREIGADSVSYPSPERFEEAAGRVGRLCMGCATGVYPEDGEPESSNNKDEFAVA